MIDERDVREMLERRAEAISATPTDEPKAIRRARRRLALNATVAGLVGLGLVAGGLAGLRMIQATPIPADRPTPPPPSRGRLAYALDGDIYVAEWDGSNAVRIADGRSPGECGWAEYWAEGPMWSPDGRYLAYRHENCPSRPENPSGVVISDPQGNVVAELPGSEFTNRTAWRISWSPDSTRFATWVTYGETIGVFGVDGARHKLLSVPPEMLTSGPVDPMWSPDGRSLLVPPDVVVPLDGSAPYTLPSAHRWPSPDGSRVAYVGDTDNSLIVAEADGSNPQVVFDGRVVVGTPDVVWSPAGDRIAFTSNRAGSVTMSGFELRVVDLATGTVTLLAEASGDVLLSVIDFSPDGDRILFSRPEGIGSLWSVDVDGSDPRRLVAGTAWGDWQPAGPMP